MTDRPSDTSVDERLMDYVYGELSDAQARQVEALLSTSAEARAQVDSLRSIRSNFASLPQGAPPTKLSYDLIRAARVAASERQAAAPKLAGLRLPRFAFRPAFASMFALLLLGGAVLTLVRTGADRPTSLEEADDLMGPLESNTPPPHPPGPTPGASAKASQPSRPPTYDRSHTHKTLDPAHVTAAATTAPPPPKTREASAKTREASGAPPNARHEPRVAATASATARATQRARRKTKRPPPPPRRLTAPPEAPEDLILSDAPPTLHDKSTAAARGTMGMAARGMATRGPSAAPPPPSILPRRAAQGVDLDALMEAAPVGPDAMALGGDARVVAGGGGNVDDSADLRPGAGPLQVDELDLLPPGAAWGEQLAQATRGKSSEAVIDRVRRRLARLSVDDRTAYVRIVQDQIASLERQGRWTEAAHLRAMLRILATERGGKEASPNSHDALDHEVGKVDLTVDVRPTKAMDRRSDEAPRGPRTQGAEQRNSGHVDAEMEEEVAEEAMKAAKPPNKAAPPNKKAR